MQRHAVHDRSAAATARVAVLAMLIVLGALSACRPVWSPDGSRVLYPARLRSARDAVVLYDRATDQAQVVFVPPGEGEVATPLWAPDGRSAVVLSTHRLQPATVQVSVVPIPAGPPLRTFTVDSDASDPFEPMLGTATVVGKQLFLTANGIVRLDLETGARASVPDGVGRLLCVHRRGEGLGYVAFRSDSVDPTVWEMGTLDPTTLALFCTMKSTDLAPWQVIARPAFSRDLSRIASPASNDAGAAILVVARGKIEATFPLGTAETVGIGDLAWSHDGATLYASLGRRADVDTWSLFETTIGGSVARETELFTSPRVRNIYPECHLQLALSPDGRTMAVVGNGLRLVDLAAKDRRVTFVPTPDADDEVFLAVSDTWLELAKAWALGCTDSHVDFRLEILPCNEPVVQALLGTAHLALPDRAPEPTAIARAASSGRVLVAHRVATDAVVACVHPDNPVAALTIDQLAVAFGNFGRTRWSDFGVTRPAAHDPIASASLPEEHPAFARFRVAVMAGRSALSQFREVARDGEAVIQFVASHPGAIGFLPLAAAAPGVKLLALAAGGRPAVVPTQATVQDDSYPLAGSIVLHGRQDARPAVVAFLRWLGSDAGRAATQSAGYTPLR